MSSNYHFFFLPLHRTHCCASRLTTLYIHHYVQLWWLSLFKLESRRFSSAHSRRYPKISPSKRLSEINRIARGWFADRPSRSLPATHCIGESYSTNTTIVYFLEVSPFSSLITNHRCLLGLSSTINTKKVDDSFLIWFVDVYHSLALNHISLYPSISYLFSLSILMLWSETKYGQDDHNNEVLVYLSLPRVFVLTSQG